MKESRFTESQIVSVLKEADVEVAVKGLCREHGISDATYYNCKSKHGGMEASDLKRLREMESELSRPQTYARRPRYGKPCAKGSAPKKA